MLRGFADRKEPRPEWAVAPRRRNIGRGKTPELDGQPVGTKDNPGKYDCYVKAESDEPLFVLLARDPLAPILVRLWLNLRIMVEPIETDKVTEALLCAVAMETWRATNRP